MFGTPDDFQTMHPGLALDREFPLPGIAALELGVERLEPAVDHLTRASIDFIRMSDGDLVVPAREATGTIVLFTER